MYTVYICDDDHTFASELANLTKRHLPQGCTVRIFTTIDSFSTAVSQQPPDIILLDIELGTGNGISLAKKLFPTKGRTQIIYITGYVEYCTAVYETEHIYFLLKPLKTQEVQLALSKAIRNLENSPPVLLLQNGTSFHKIPVAEIYYIESHNRKLHVHTQTQVFESIGKLSALPSDVTAKLISCHKSFLVNPKFIQGIRSPANSFNKFFYLISGESIPISQSKWRESQHHFLSLLSSGDF